MLTRPCTLAHALAQAPHAPHALAHACNTPACAAVARTQKNKATENHLGLLKAKLAKLRAEVVSGPKGGSSKPGEGFDVTKSGDVRVGAYE